ncbi:PEMT/PEM2 family methyltransferase [Maricaulis sp.]|uniref:PEMT/PEM2 family methyltransferase n=1 Tax=Maricaulis sp. TaxID=1486257 RepID=UPI003A8FF750
MSLLAIVLCVYILFNAILAIPFMIRARREFERQGKWTPATASWSGGVMHGQALATLALAIVDRGSLWPVTAVSLAAGGLLLSAGAGVIAAGRIAYGSQKRVYGLLEDRLIEGGIYRFSRNPQYVGYAAMFFGAAAAAGSILALTSSALFALIIHVFITRVEEPHLDRVFAAAYADYRARIRRYL